MSAKRPNSSFYDLTIIITSRYAGSMHVVTSVPSPLSTKSEYQNCQLAPNLASTKTVLFTNTLQTSRVSQGHPTERLCKVLPPLREYDRSSTPVPRPTARIDITKTEMRGNLDEYCSYLISTFSHGRLRTLRGRNDHRNKPASLATPSTHDRPAGRAVPSADVRIVRTNKRHDRSTY